MCSTKRNELLIAEIPKHHAACIAVLYGAAFILFAYILLFSFAFLSMLIDPGLSGLANELATASIIWIEQPLPDVVCLSSLLCLTVGVLGAAILHAAYAIVPFSHLRRLRKGWLCLSFIMLPIALVGARLVGDTITG